MDDDRTSGCSPKYPDGLMGMRGADNCAKSDDRNGPVPFKPCPKSLHRLFRVQTGSGRTPGRLSLSDPPDLYYCYA